MHIPHGRTADKPQDPTLVLSDNLVPHANVPPTTPRTQADFKDSFFKPGDPAINAETAAGPKGPRTRPGGNDYLNDVLHPSATDDSGQCSFEGEDRFDGPMTRGKVRFGVGRSKLDNLYS
jgi:hypothetical protein